MHQGGVCGLKVGSICWVLIDGVRGGCNIVAGALD